MWAETAEREGIAGSPPQGRLSPNAGSVGSASAGLRCDGPSRRSRTRRHQRRRRCRRKSEAVRIDSLYEIVSMLNGITLIIVGIAVRRARAWTGWARFNPLASGIYVRRAALDGIPPRSRGVRAVRPRPREIERADQPRAGRGWCRGKNRPGGCPRPRWSNRSAPPATRCCRSALGFEGGPGSDRNGVCRNPVERPIFFV